MKSSSIKSMINGELPYKDFKLILSKEMGEYLSGSKERGKSQPVYLDEDVDLFIGERNLKALFQAFLSGFLDLKLITQLMQFYYQIGSPLKMKACPIG